MFPGIHERAGTIAGFEGPVQVIAPRRVERGVEDSDCGYGLVSPARVECGRTVPISCGGAFVEPAAVSIAIDRFAVQVGKSENDRTRDGG